MARKGMEWREDVSDFNQKVYDFLADDADMVTYMDKVDTDIGHATPNPSNIQRFLKNLKEKLDNLVEESENL